LCASTSLRDLPHTCSCTWCYYSKKKWKQNGGSFNQRAREPLLKFKNIYFLDFFEERDDLFDERKAPLNMKLLERKSKTESR
jgi:hypothetical protein